VGCLATTHDTEERWLPFTQPDPTHASSRADECTDITGRDRDRTSAHVLLCWLALLLIRVTENETGKTWRELKNIFHPLLIAEHQTNHGIITQTNPLTTGQKAVLDALNLKPPPRYPSIPTPKKR